MSVQIKGVGTIGGIDQGLNTVGVITATSLVGTGVSVVGVITATSFVGSGANLTSLPAQATLSNNADNRVITGGSGTNLNGEANLTLDGTTILKQQFTATNTYAANDTTQCGYQAHNLSDTTNTYAAIRLTAGSSSPATAQIASIRTGTGQNDLTFQLETGNTAFEALRIDSSGRVLIGSTAKAGDSALQVYTSDRLHPAMRVHSGNANGFTLLADAYTACLLYTSPSPRDATLSRMPSSA